MKALLTLLTAVQIYAASLIIDDFSTDLYSKQNSLKPIELSLKIIGENLERDYLQDALNMVISSYFYEDLFTERGKENLKKTLIKYASKKYSIEIEQILILNLKSKNTAETLRQILKDANLL